MALCPAKQSSAFDGGLAGAVVPLFQNALINFFAVNLDVVWRLDADSNLIPLDPQNGDRDVITDDKFLSNSSCQYKHFNLPLVSDTFMYPRF